MLAAIIERDSALRAKEKRYRALVENAGDAVLLFDAAGHVVDVNPRACIDLGFTYDELLGKVFGELCTARDGGVLPGLDAAVTSPAPVTVDVVHRRKELSTYPAELRLARYEEGGRTRFLALSRDQSEHDRVVKAAQKARAAAESANAAKTRFLANVNHEIRTPMTSVVAMTDLLGRSPLDEQQRRYVDIARHSADVLLGLLDDILELSWTDSGRLSLDSLAFHVESLIDDVLELFAQRAREKGLDLASLVDGDVPAVLHGDPRHLRQILINLIGNAVKFTDHGEVSVRVECTGTDGDSVILRFTVQDTGIGIPGSMQRELFEPFVQQDSSSTRRHGGAGIGLTISRSLVELMGGTIGVDSELDAGSRFWFTTRLQHGVEQAAQEQQPSFAGVYAVVMETNAAVRGALAARLRHMGMTVEARGDADSAREITTGASRTSRPVQLLFAGLPAAKESGSRQRLVEFLSSLGDGRAHGGIKVILMVPLGESLPELALDAQLTKPVRHSTLVDTVTRVLRGERDMTRPRAPAAAALARPSGSPPRVLLADDDAAIRMSLSLVLETLGYGCRCVSNGEEALQAIAQEHFDLVLMDCQMPVMDGCQATRALRSRETDEQHLPVVGITGFVTEGERERCIKAGMDEHLVKPVSISTLEAVLAARVDTRGGSVA
jgi:PAS domain S-box-containing protein